MAFDGDVLLQRLGELLRGVVVDRYLVGFSGGLDSTVLLHALARTRAVHGVSVVAVHVNHGLHADAAVWEQHCRRFADELGVAYIGRHVTIDDAQGLGVEAAARKARYGAIEALMQENDVLLSAHHEEDQAETLLLNLMRGSGLTGLAGIGVRRRLGKGQLVRPMLRTPRHDIEAYAREFALEWIDDPANSELRFDRNFLRLEILPSLRRRWPAVSTRLRRSAELAAESARLQDDLAQIDLALLLVPPSDMTAPDRLDIAALSGLSGARQRNVLRYAIRACGLPPAPASRLRQAEEELLPAREDARPLVRWPGAELRRYRRTLYVLPELADISSGIAVSAARLYGDGREVDAGSGLGRLCLERVAAGAGPALDPDRVAHGLELRSRQGGEKIRPADSKVTRPLKKLLQEHGVVPWMRERVPLLYAGETLVAVADLWIAAECATEGGFRVRWLGKPPIY